MVDHKIGGKTQEAKHNVLEKVAEKKELQACLDEGLSKNDPITKERIEAARKGVLEDETLKDAPLTDIGKEQAIECRTKLADTIQRYCLPPPTRVYVSPLTRTLETCNIIFQDLDDIHVRSELEERRTGKPPDTRSGTSTLMERQSFGRFSMQDLLQQSMLNQLEETLLMTSLSSLSSQISLEKDDIHTMSQNLMGRTIEDEDLFTEEDKAMLRERTLHLFSLLKESNERSLAVVTHKG